MKRREFLITSLAAACGAAVSGRAQSRPGPAGLTGRVVRRGQPGYDDARQDYNARLSRSPAAIVFCTSAGDVVRAIQWARQNHVPFCARCGGHSYEGYSLVDDGLVIDVSPLRGVHLDAARQTVRMGAGLRLLDLYEALWPHHVTVPGGSCATVGIAGLTLGGGYGLLARRFGLTCDHLQAVEVVLADGQVVRADSEHHADLLWACQGGGGGNFGIVTEFTFHVRPVSSVAVYRLTWDWADLAAVLNAWQGWAPTVDDRLTCLLKLRARSNGTLSSVGQFVGPLSELSALLKPLRKAGSPREASVQTVSYLDACRQFAGLKSDSAHGPPQAAGARPHFKASSDYAARPLGPDAIAVIRRFLETAPSPSNLVQMENYGGAIGRVAPSATAFCHRAGTLFNLQYQAYWNQTAAEPSNAAWVAGFREAMAPFVTGGAYGNYCDAGIADWPRAYYGDNLARLRQVKAAYDPHDLFHSPQSIRPG